MSATGRSAAACVLVAVGALALPGPAHAVAGGAPVADGTYPFAAKVEVGEVRSCSGALVAPRWVMTAARCFLTADGQPPSGPPAQPTTVIVGRTDLSTAGGTVATVTEVVARPDRNVVLAKLDRPAGAIVPVPVSAVAPAPGEDLHAVGYGRTATEWAPDKLNAATFTVQSVTATTAAIAGRDSASLCKGDAGGPALREEAGRAELVAIHDTSWQKGCLAETETRTGAVESRVDDLRGWVRAVTHALPAGTATQLAAGTFTGDAHADVVAVEAGKLVLHPALARGGGFGRPVEIPGDGGGLTELTDAQFTGTARTDLLGIDARTGTLWLYPDLTGARIALAEGWAGLRDVAAADLTQDGRADVVAVDDATGVLWIYPGAEGVSLRPRTQLATGWRDLRGLAAADFTGDARADLVTVDGAGTLWLYPGTPGGGLGPRSSLGTGWAEASELTALDLTHDGVPDLLSLDEPSGKLQLAVGTADHRLGARTDLAWATPSPPESHDHNRDGRTDIALTGPSGWNTLPVATSRGDGSFAVTNDRIGDFAAWSGASGVRQLTGDFNGDGRTDVALTSGPGWNTLPVATSRGDGSFTVTNAFIGDFAAWSGASGVRQLTGDFNGDGRTDIALIGGPGWNTLPVATSRGDGSFTVTNAFIGDFAAWSTTAGVKQLTGDFNGDGRTDIALTGPPTWNTLPVATSRGDGSFAVTNASIGAFAGWSGASGVRQLTGDFNGDGRTDIALIGGPGWNTLPVATSRGDGSFTVTNTFIGDFAALSTTVGVKQLTGDFNGDGRTDIALTGPPTWNTLPVATSRGDGSFAVTNASIGAFAGWSGASGVRQLTGDFNGDGRTDIALIGGPGWNTLPVATSRGEGSFTVTNSFIGDFVAWSTTPRAVVL